MCAPTYYRLKSQFLDITDSHLAQLRQLQDENAKRKYADLATMDRPGVRALRVGMHQPPPRPPAWALSLNRRFQEGEIR